MAVLVRKTAKSIIVTADEDVVIIVYKLVKNNLENLKTFNYNVSEVSLFTFNPPSDGLYVIRVVNPNYSGGSGGGRGGGVVKDPRDPNSYENGNEPIQTEHGIIVVDTEINVPSEISGQYIDFYISFFPKLIANIANEFKGFLCKNTDNVRFDCNVNFKNKYINLATKINYLETYTLKALTIEDKVNYLNFVFSVLNSIPCNSEKIIDKIINEECNNGISTDRELYTLFTVIKFLGLYFVEYKNDYGEVTFEPQLTASNYISNIFNFKGWKDCVCKTCIDLNTALEMFNSGTSPGGSGDINLPPLGDDLFKTIEGNGNYFEYNLKRTDFSAVFQDDHVQYPYSVIITDDFNNFTLLDLNDNVINAPIEIPFSDIENYKVVYTTSVTEIASDRFGFKLSDGINSSPRYYYTFSLIKVQNLPPFVMNGFEKDLFVSGHVLISKSELFNSGSVVDREDDLIKFFKVVARNLNVEIYNGTTYDPLALEDEVDLDLFTDNGPFLKVSLGLATTPHEKFISLAFKDVGSNEYSNFGNPGNVMRIIFNVINKINLIFTGVYNTPIVNKKNWIPLSRIEYSGDINEISAEILNQSGYVDDNIALMIVPATSDTPYGSYSNIDSILVPNTTSPPLNTYDVYAYTNILSNRTINFKLVKGNEILLQSSASFVTPSITASLSMISILEFSETNIADFNYLNDENTFPDNFITSVPILTTSDTKANLFKGKKIQFNTLGLKGFAFDTATAKLFDIYDELDNNISASFTSYHSVNNELQVIISNDVYIPTTIYLKLKIT